MLDLTQILDQIGEATLREGEHRQRIHAATIHAATHICTFDTQTWAAQIARIRTADAPWQTAHCTELPAAAFPCPELPLPHVVMAVDGSQVAPDRHEGIGGCYLLNASQIVLSYGTNQRARLDAVPRVMTLNDEQGPDDDGDSTARDAVALSMHRYAHEMRAISELIEESAGSLTSTVALTDGSLIAWHLYDRDMGSDPTKKLALDALKAALAKAREHRVPIAGYVSDSRSRDVVSALRITLCPEDNVMCGQCRSHSPRIDAPDPPCHAYAGVTDTELFARILQVGERSPVFTSRDQARGYSRILQQYHADDWIDFFYLNVEQEVARVEIPRWVTEDPALLDRVHAICFDQACKGRGYPVALAEAHERAIVRGADRQAFLNCVQRSFVQSQLNIDVTRKALAKRMRSL